MNFITITQYFNKLYSVLFALLMVPLLIFIALYFFINGLPSSSPVEYIIVILIATLLDWSAAWLIFDKKIKSLRNEQGLGGKLDKYFQVTVVRYGLLSSGSFMLAAGLYLFRNDLFTVTYLGSLILACILWPTGRKVCRDLRLKGDEKEMVFFKKDVF